MIGSGLADLLPPDLGFDDDLDISSISFTVLLASAIVIIVSCSSIGGRLSWGTNGELIRSSSELMAPGAAGCPEDVVPQLMAAGFILTSESVDMLFILSSDCFPVSTWLSFGLFWLYG